MNVIMSRGRRAGENWRQTEQDIGANPERLSLALFASLKGAQGAEWYRRITKGTLTAPLRSSVEDLSSQVNDLLTTAEIKTALKSIGQPSYGNKAVLKIRLLTAYSKFGPATKIQRVFRGYLVRECEKMRGPGYKNLCSSSFWYSRNDRDAGANGRSCSELTYEDKSSPLLRRGALNNVASLKESTEFFAFNDTSRELFFSYRSLLDDRVYIFDAFELMSMFKCDRRIVNPHNREEFPVKILCRLFSLYKKIRILYPLVKCEI